MKKIFSLFSIVYLLSHVANAQVNELKVGIKVFPALAWSRVEPETYRDEFGNLSEFGSQPVKLRGGFGIFGDYYFNDNLAFSTGLYYYVAGSGFKIKDASGTQKYDYAMQNFQVPLALKLFTNEIVDNLQVYFSAGTAVDFRTNTNVNGKNNFQPATGPSKSYNEWTYLLGLNLQAGAGIEYKLQNDMKVILGFTYSRGLFNVSNNDAFRNAYNKSFSLKNDYVGLDLGLKF